MGTFICISSIPSLQGALYIWEYMTQGMSKEGHSSGGVKAGAAKDTEADDRGGNGSHEEEAGRGLCRELCAQWGDSEHPQIGPHRFPYCCTDQTQSLLLSCGPVACGLRHFLLTTSRS